MSMSSNRREGHMEKEYYCTVPISEFQTVPICIEIYKNMKKIIHFVQNTINIFL